MKYSKAQSIGYALALWRRQKVAEVGRGVDPLVGPTFASEMPFAAASRLL